MRGDEDVSQDFLQSWPSLEVRKGKTSTWRWVPHQPFLGRSLFLAIWPQPESPNHRQASNLNCGLNHRKRWSFMHILFVNWSMTVYSQEGSTRDSRSQSRAPQNPEMIVGYGIKQKKALGGPGKCIMSPSLQVQAHTLKSTANQQCHSYSWWLDATSHLVSTTTLHAATTN